MADKPHTSRCPSVSVADIIDLATCSALFNYFISVKHVRCGGSLVAHWTSRAKVLGSSPASPTMILVGCRMVIMCNKVENLRVEGETYP